VSLTEINLTPNKQKIKQEREENQQKKKKKGEEIFSTDDGKPWCHRQGTQHWPKPLGDLRCGGLRLWW